MNDYTPPTEQVREIYSEIRHESTGLGLDPHRAEFDRWLDQVKAEACTLDPLPDPEPDWLDAPAVLAVCNDSMDRAVLVRENEAGTQWVRDTKVYRRDELIDVVPLYPKGQDA